MNNKTIIMKENFLTKKPRYDGLIPTLLLILILFSGSSIYLNQQFHAEVWMPASAQMVFQKREYWRVFSTLLAHGDLGHILSNLVLFIPFSYFLIGYFGITFFPIIGFISGALINLLVLKTMPNQVWLIGCSGVVYWMGAAWMTLAFLIDRRDSYGKSFIKVVGISAVLFVPDTFQSDVSYLSHFVGYILGIFSSGLYYILFRKSFRKFDVYEEILEDENFELDLIENENVIDEIRSEVGSQT